MRRRPARDRRGPDGVLRLPAHLRGLPGVPRRPRGDAAADVLKSLIIAMILIVYL